jgi:pantoate--beta-alanine ligase
MISLWKSLKSHSHNIFTLSTSSSSSLIRVSCCTFSSVAFCRRGTSITTTTTTSSSPSFSSSSLSFTTFITSNTSLRPHLNPSSFNSTFFQQPIRGLKVLRSIGEVRRERQLLTDNGIRTIGFVPTMGALHTGHLELAKHSLQGTQATFVSIFVNPTQFLPHEDLNKYPRQLERDLQLLTEHNVPYVFCPSVDEMYPTASPLPPHKTYVSIENIDKDVLEAQSRPGHFRGVATVVTKLFNIVQPTHAYFGQKDGIQCIVIQRMIRELNFPVSMQTVPTLRAEDGLALSSRNVYLSAEERKLAPIIYQSLQRIEKHWESNESTAEPATIHNNHNHHHPSINGNSNTTTTKRNKTSLSPALSIEEIKTSIRSFIETESKGKLKVQYISVASTLTGEEIPDSTIIGTQDDPPYLSYLISLAVYAGNVRLIDNIVLKPRIKLPTEY